MRVAISYRRHDTLIAAGVLNGVIRERVGAASTFLDLLDIPPGVDYRQHISDAIAASDVLLVVIGSNWDARRLFDPDDMVRFELETAHARGLRVVPVLVPPQTSMPQPTDLPESVRYLCSRQAWVSSATAFEESSRQLVASLMIHHPGAPLPPPTPLSPPAAPSVVPSANRLEIATPAILLNITRTWSPKMDPVDLYECTRGAWRCWGDRRELTVGGHAFGFASGTVRSVYRIREWRYRTPTDRFGDHDIGEKRPRMMFEGVSGPAMFDEDLQYLGTSVRHLVTNPQLAFVYLNC